MIWGQLFSHLNNSVFHFSLKIHKEGTPIGREFHTPGAISEKVALLMEDNLTSTKDGMWRRPPPPPDLHNDQTIAHPPS